MSQTSSFPRRREPGVSFLGRVCAFAGTTKIVAVCALMAVASPLLEGQVAAASGDLNAAIASYRRAVEAEDKLNYDEPAAPEVCALSPLPEGWCWATTAQLLSFVTSGSRGWAQYYSESGPMFIRIGNLDHDSIRLDLSDIQHVSPPAGAEGTRTC